MTITLPIELESALRQRAALAGKDIETFVREILTEEVSNQPTKNIRTLSHEEFVAKLRGIIALHSESNGKMDDSRESIYAGCGE